MMPGAPPMPAPSSTAEVQPEPANVASLTVVAGAAADQPAVVYLPTNGHKPADDDR